MVGIKSGLWFVEVSPEIGGSIITCQYDGYNILRKAFDTAIAAKDILGVSSFPLVPYSNRISDGRFVFEGKEVYQKPNLPNHPDNLHGHGWQQPWSVIEAREDFCELEYRHAPNEWPWDYVARQRFLFENGQFVLEMDIKNLSDSNMPVGLGHHPYFQRTPHCSLKTGLRDMWLANDKVIPIEKVSVPADVDFSSGREIDSVRLDNCFTGWSGLAEFSWPDYPFKATMTGDEKQKFAVIFTPSGEDFFCVEGVTNMTDAFCRMDSAEEDGLYVLAPNETYAIRNVFKVEPV